MVENLGRMSPEVAEKKLDEMESMDHKEAFKQFRDGFAPPIILALLTFLA